MVNQLKLLVNLIRIWPHLLVYVFCRNKLLIQQDVTAWKSAIGLKKGSTYSLLFLLSNYPEFRNVFYIRIGYWGHALHLICPKLNSLFITTDDIKGGLFIQHGFATIISADSIGENCWINQQVTIGYSNKTDCPKIGNHVHIYAGAKVIGGVTIGDYAIVGANCVVVKDVPANSVVVGNPARMVKLNGEKVNIPL
jgi:serine O-acetyltransferase